MERIEKFGALLRSIIQEIKLLLPPQEIKGVYQPGDEYAFYRDLGDAIRSAQRDVFIVDAYVDRTIFDLYADKVAKGVTLRILSSNVEGDFAPVARVYANGNPLEVRTTSGIHDRHIFIDDRGWLIGQSIKDAAAKKPTYLVEFSEPDLSASRSAYNTIWSSATQVTI